MALPELFEIEFVGGNVFKPGDLVQGFVSLRNSYALSARRILLRGYGGARVNFEDSVYDQYTNQLVPTQFYAEQQYFNFEVQLWGSPLFNWTLPPGNYRFPFAFWLPVTCQFAVTCEYGEIQYQLIARIDIPLAPDARIYRTFEVVPPCDLNQVLQAFQPVSVLFEDNGGWFCCPKYCSAKMMIHKAGFASGETVPVRLELTNKNAPNMVEVEMYIRQRIVLYGFYGGARRSREVTQKLAVIRVPCNVPPGSQQIVEGKFLVPLLPGPNFTCSIILVTHEFFIDVHTDSMMTSSLLCHVPICLGTVAIPEIQPAQLEQAVAAARAAEVAQKAEDEKKLAASVAQKSVVKLQPGQVLADAPATGADAMKEDKERKAGKPGAAPPAAAAGAPAGAAPAPAPAPAAAK